LAAAGAEATDGQPLLVETTRLVKIYQDKEHVPVRALNEVDFRMASGEGKGRTTTGSCP